MYRFAGVAGAPRNARLRSTISLFTARREGKNLREGRGGEYAASLGSLALLGKLAYARLFLCLPRGARARICEKVKVGGRLPLCWGR